MSSYVILGATKDPDALCPHHLLRSLEKNAQDNASKEPTSQVNRIKTNRYMSCCSI
jgi:hypothetical protein